MSRRIDKLLPVAQLHLNAAIAEMVEKKVSHFINSTLRTEDEQAAYWAQSRFPLEEVNARRKKVGFYLLTEEENKHSVTNADGVKNKSLHQSGRAVDILPLDSKGRPFWPNNDSKLWIAIAEIMENHGFEWGGRWTKEKDGIAPDCPHYQLKGGIV